MPPPPNTTIETATVMSMPYAVALEVTEAAAPAHTVWFRYTAVAGDYQMSWRAYATPGSVYEVRTDVYVGSPSSYDTHLNILATAGRSLQLPLTAGQTYFFRVQNTGSTEPLDSQLLVATSKAQNVATMEWTIAIPDDTPGFPMALYAPSTGTIQQFRPHPAGETAHVLPSGISLWQDATTQTTLRLYDAALSPQSAPGWTFSGHPPMSSNRVDTFYVGDKGTAPAPARITTISSTGALGPTVWTLPHTGLVALGVSRDETVLYYYGNATGAEAGAISRWDLVTDLPLTPLAGVLSGYVTKDPILVLDDESVIVGYSAASDNLVRRYHRDGTLLHTYPLGAPRLGHLTHFTDDTAFWVWLHLTGDDTGWSRFQLIRVSDGVVITSFDAPQYEGGIYQGLIEVTHDAFGHSFSCPFILVPPLPPYGGGPGGPDAVTPPYVAPSYHLDARYIRRLRRAPHVAQEHSRVFYRRFELDLERGQGLATGQGSDPMVLLRISRDGGQTWGEEQRMAAGRLGEYTARVIARRLGQARDTVFEVVVSDPIAWSLVGAWLDLEAGTS